MYKHCVRLKLFALRKKNHTISMFEFARINLNIIIV